MIKTVLITGASKGIGLATSKKLVDEGYTVIGIARTAPPNYPGILFDCDLTDLENTSKTLNKINSEFQIDGIINNVGIVKPQPLGKINLDFLDEVYNLNVRTAVQVVQFFVSAMKENNYGRIINIASRAILGGKELSSYSASKNALVGLTRTWALELAPFNITVNAIAPGFIDTTLLTLPTGIDRNEAALKTPLGRIGRPEEIAATVEFLISEGAAFMTGQTLFVDGGRSI